MPVLHSHSETLPDVPVGSIDLSIDAAISNCDLQMSVEWELVETLTWDVLLHYCQIRNLKSTQEGQINLPLNPGCWGSLGMTTESMGEACASCNQCRDTSAMRLPNPVMTQMSCKCHKPSQHKSQIHFKLDTFICNNILLHLAKYIH